MPTLRGPLPEFPWDSLAPYARTARAHRGGLINLSVGSPVDPVPKVVREALATGADAPAYPATAGAPELREAIRAWLHRRRGVEVGVDGVVPTVGSKELIALLPFLLGIGPGEAVVYPRVAYPSYEMGASFVGAEAIASDDPAEWPERTRLVWLNSPGNPDGRVLGVERLRAAVSRARELGAVIIGDECYAEFGWEAPWDEDRIPSILDPRVVGDGEHAHRGILMAYSLSKQSNLAGYRAAFVAGDPELVQSLIQVRKHAGLMVPDPVQTVMTVALADDAHVREQRERYRSRRETLLPAVEAFGYRVEGSEAGIYLWVRPEGADEPSDGVPTDAWASVQSFAELGLLVGPGHFYGTHSPAHVRLALTALDAAIEEAAHRLRNAAKIRN